MRKKFLLFMTLIWALQPQYLSALEYEGLNYSITSEDEKTASVSSNDNIEGVVVIPSSIQISGITYSVTSIGAGAFRNCKSLTSITIPGSVTSIGNRAFEECTSLKELRIEDSDVTLSLGYQVWGGNGWAGEGLFYDCPIATLYLGRNLSYETSFYGGYSPFYGKPLLSEVTLGNPVNSTHRDLFKSTVINTLIINEAVSSLGSVQIPSSLRIVTSNNPIPPTAGASTFNSATTENGVLFVPESSISTYQYSPYWMDFKRIEAIPNSGNGDSNNQNSDNIFNAKIDKYLYLSLNDEISFTDFVPSGVTVSSWESSDDDIVEVTKKGKAEAYNYGNVIVRALNSDGEPLVTFGVFVCPTIKINYGDIKTYEHHVIYNSIPTLYIAAPEGFKIVSISHEGMDITDIVKNNDGYYSPNSPLNDNSIISVVLNNSSIKGDLNGDGKVDGVDLNMLIDQIMNF